MNRAASILIAGLAMIAGLPASLLLFGCADGTVAGYRAGPVHDTGIRSVAVPIFENETYEPGLEARLTEAVIKQIQTTTPWRVTGEAYADTVLTGSITNVFRTPLTRRAGSNLPEEAAYFTRISFVWTDSRTGRVLAQRSFVTAASTFVPNRLVGETIEVARDTSSQELARQIVRELQAEW